MHEAEYRCAIAETTGAITWENDHERLVSSRHPRKPCSKAFAITVPRALLAQAVEASE
jgi:hypothetical protein